MDDDELITRRRVVRRRRSPDVPEAFPEFEHNQWTFEGEIERLGGYARGVHRERRRGGWMYWTGWLVAVAFLLPLVIGVLQLIF